MIIHYETENVGEEMILYFSISSQHSPRRTKENQQYLSWDRQCCIRYLNWVLPKQNLDALALSQPNWSTNKIQNVFVISCYECSKSEQERILWTDITAKLLENSITSTKDP
jgi:hypothetical protein